MKVILDHFGIIGHGEMEMKGISVISGENNTGKSMLGRAVYSLLTAFYDYDHKVKNKKKELLENVLQLFTIGNSTFAVKIPRVIVDLLDMEEPDFIKVNAYFETMGIRVTDHEKIIKKIVEYLTYETQDLENTIINEVFDDEFRRQIPMNAKISLDSNTHHVSIEFQENKAFVMNGKKVRHNVTYIDDPFVMDKVDRDRETIYMITSHVCQDGVQRHVNDVRKKLTTPKKTRKADAVYQEKAEVFLNRFKEILKGDFVEDEDQLKFYDIEKDREIALYNLSAGSKTFAILMRLLQNGVIKNNACLILDEPDAYLHPKWQLLYTECIVMMQKAFHLHIVLITNSPYMINAIEVYSKKYKTDKKCKYYLSEKKDHNVELQDVSKKMERLYQGIAQPFHILEEEN